MAGVAIMIKIRLNPTIFATGGYFDGVPQNRAVLVIKTGRDDIYAGKIEGDLATNLNWRGGQLVLQIDARGTEMEDLSFETCMKNEISRTSYGSQILDLMQKGLIIVEQNGTALTATQINTFTA